MFGVFYTNNNQGDLIMSSCLIQKLQFVTKKNQNKILTILLFLVLLYLLMYET